MDATAAKGTEGLKPADALLDLLPPGPIGLAIGVATAALALAVAIVVIRTVFLRPMGRRTFQTGIAKIVGSTLLKGPQGGLEALAKEAAGLWADAVGSGPSSIGEALVSERQDIEWRAFRDWFKTTGLSRSRLGLARAFWQRHAPDMLLSATDLEAFAFDPSACTSEFKQRFFLSASAPDGLHRPELVAALWSVLAPLYPTLLGRPAVQPALLAILTTATLRELKGQRIVTDDVHRLSLSSDLKLDATLAKLDVIQASAGDKSSFEITFGRMIGVPRHTRDMLPRTELMDRLRNGLLGRPSAKGQRRIALIGGGGSGKTTLAALIAGDDTIREAFPDGVFWASLGQSPEVATKHSAWLAVMSGQPVTFPSPDASKAFLQMHFSDRRALLVIDDVWDLSDLDSFLVGGNNCALLLTSRETKVAFGAAAETVQVGALRPSESLDLLDLRAGDRVPDETADLSALVEALGHLPLAVELAAHQLSEGYSARQLCTEILEEIHLMALDIPGAEHERDSEIRRKLSLDACLELSLRRLPEQRLAQLSLLSVLRTSTDFTAALAGHLLNLSASQAETVLRDLVSRSLVEFSNPDGAHPAYRLHAVIWASARARLAKNGDEKQALVGFLGRCNPNRPSGWDLALDDSHLAEHLTYYLAESGDLKDLLWIVAWRNRANGLFSPGLWLERRRGRAEEDLFSVDIRRILEHAATKSATEVKNQELLARAALADASLNEMNADIDVTLCRALAASGLWSDGQAVAHAKRRFDPAGLAVVAAGLREPFSSELAKEAVRRGVAAANLQPLDLIRCAEAASGETRLNALRAARRLFEKFEQRTEGVEHWDRVDLDWLTAALRLRILFGEANEDWQPYNEIDAFLKQIQNLRLPIYQESIDAYNNQSIFAAAVKSVEALLYIQSEVRGRSAQAAREAVERLFDSRDILARPEYAALGFKFLAMRAPDMNLAERRSLALKAIVSPGSERYAGVSRDPASHWMSLGLFTRQTVDLFGDDLEFLSAATGAGIRNEMARSFVDQWLRRSGPSGDVLFAESSDADFGSIAASLVHHGGLAPPGRGRFKAPTAFDDVIKLYASSGLLSRHGRPQRLISDILRVSSDVDRVRLFETVAPALGRLEVQQALSLCNGFTQFESSALAYMVAGTLVDESEREPFISAAVAQYRTSSSPSDALAALSRYAGYYSGGQVADLARAAATLAGGIGDARKLQLSFTRASLSFPAAQRRQLVKSAFWDWEDTMPWQSAIESIPRDRALTIRPFWTDEKTDLPDFRCLPDSAFLAVVQEHFANLDPHLLRSEHYKQLADIAQEMTMRGLDGHAINIAEVMSDTAIMYR